MSVSYLSNVGGKRSDLVFKAIFTVVALIALLWLGAVVHRRVVQ